MNTMVIMETVKMMKAKKPTHLRVSFKFWWPFLGSSCPGSNSWKAGWIRVSLAAASEFLLFVVEGGSMVRRRLFRAVLLFD
jgi:hypothetical protein